MGIGRNKYLIKEPIETIGKILSLEQETAGAVITVKSLKTQKDFTYNIKRWKTNTGKWFTSVSVEQQGSVFLGLGNYFRGKLWYGGSVVEQTKAVEAIQYVLDKIENKLPMPNVEIFHRGTCLKCGRPLTDSDSIEIGIGPTCRA